MGMMKVEKTYYVCDACEIEREENLIKEWGYVSFLCGNPETIPSIFMEKSYKLLCDNCLAKINEVLSPRLDSFIAWREQAELEAEETKN